MTMYENPMIVDSYWCDSLSCPELFPAVHEKAKRYFYIAKDDARLAYKHTFSRKKVMPHVREYFW